jgi:hypothetical protein
VGYTKRRVYESPISDIMGPLRTVRTRVVADQRIGYQNLDEEAGIFVLGCSAGRRLAMCCRTILLLEAGTSGGIVPSGKGMSGL